MKSLLRLRLAGAVGIGLLLAGLLLYRSYENRPVFGLWSYPYFSVIVVATILLAVLMVRSWRIARTADRPGFTCRRLPGAFLDFALLFWGLAFLLSALDDPSSPGRITDLVLLGSVMPAAALLEWLAVTLVVLAIAVLAATRFKEKWINPALVLGAVLAVILLAEGAFRVKVAIAPATQGSPTYSEKQWLRRHVELNQQGFRDLEHTLAHRPEARRILVVGDSFAFGVGIERIGDRFGEQLARQLAEETGQVWESVNASLGNTHTLQHIEFLVSGLAYMPEIVILLYVFNDINYLRPAADYAGAIRAPRSLIDRLRPLWLLYNNSYLFQELFVHGRLVYYQFGGDDTQDPYSDTALLDRHFEDIARFVETAAESGATVAVVPFEHRNLGSDQARSRYGQFVESAAQAGIPVWPMTETFAGYPIDQLTVNKLDSHPNELAHRLAASAISERILADLAKQSQ